MRLALVRTAVAVVGAVAAVELVGVGAAEAIVAAFAVAAVLATTHQAFVPSRAASAAIAAVAGLAVGHGESGREPPWDSATHVGDLLETLEAAEVERVSWIGHSFGGRLVAEAAAVAPERSERLVLLDPALAPTGASASASAPAPWWSPGARWCCRRRRSPSCRP